MKGYTVVENKNSVAYLGGTFLIPEELYNISDSDWFFFKFNESGGLNDPENGLTCSVGQEYRFNQNFEFVPWEGVAYATIERNSPLVNHVCAYFRFDKTGGDLLTLDAVVRPYDFSIDKVKRGELPVYTLRIRDGVLRIRYFDGKKVKDISEDPNGGKRVGIMPKPSQEDVQDIDYSSINYGYTFGSDINIPRLLPNKDDELKISLRNGDISDVFFILQLATMDITFSDFFDSVKQYISKKKLLRIKKLDGNLISINYES